MTYAFHRHTKTNYPTAVKGEGCYIIDSTGKRYLDASGGAAVSCLGHSHPKVREAMHAQIDTLAFAHTGFFTNEPLELLAETLVKQSPDGIGKVYFVSGGSEAVEGALKMARQYFVETGKPEKHKIITRWQSYHGNTLGALSAGGNRWRRAQFGPLLLEMYHISPCYEYRGKQDGESSFDYGQRVANELEAKILEQGPETVAAFIAEPVVGATMGCVPAVEGYLKRVREICTKYDVLLILDEVMCGMGRTGTLFACEHDGVSPDLITIAKGLGGGYQPIGAIMVASKIFDAISKGTGFFQHGHTYMGHATACAAALAVNQAIVEEKLLENVNAQGAAFRKALESAFGSHPYVGDIRGRGLFLGVEIVADKATKEAFDPSLKINAKLKTEAMNQGLMCYPMGGTIDGQTGDHVMFAPPFIINASHVEEIAQKFGKALDTVFPQEAGLAKAS
ncbi:MAG: putative aminotransferase [Rickettsiales bacterium]|jgi:adenosylmethionine-8-amino-7-oxononanoate aminotransferase|nr:putative aminotransferase [Rickettsiales bacterium]